MYLDNDKGEETQYPKITSMLDQQLVELFYQEDYRRFLSMDLY